MSILQKRNNGTSDTYLFGERYINPFNYHDGKAPDDNENLYVGHDNDNARGTHPNHGPPAQDRPGVSNPYIFGSAHSGVWQAVLCDGSVRGISYSIDANVHRHLGHRSSGEVIGAF